MYYIDSSFDEPDIEYMYNCLKESSKYGIALSPDIINIYNNVYKSYEESAKNLEHYGIMNPDSSKQVLGYISRSGDPNIYEACYKNGKWTSKKTCIAKLAQQDCAFAIDLLTYRKAKSFKNALSGLIEHMDVNGRVHPEVRLGNTNRIQYAEPALMSVPKQLLWSVIAPFKSGDYLISVDIKNEEPWLLINMLGIESLKPKLDSENHSGLYDSVFKELFGRECTPLERKELKAAWNAITYGATKPGIIEMCTNIDGAVVYNYISKIKELKEYRDRCKANSKRNVHTVKTYFGTELYADDLGSKLARQLMNIPIQGTGADILALLIEHFYSEVEEQEIGDNLDIYYTRHDELVIEAKKEYVEKIGLEEVYNQLRDIFEFQIDDWEPFSVEIGVVQKSEQIEQLLRDSNSDDDEE